MEQVESRKTGDTVSSESVAIARPVLLYTFAEKAKLSILLLTYSLGGLTLKAMCCLSSEVMAPGCPMER